MDATTLLDDPTGAPLSARPASAAPPRVRRAWAGVDRARALHRAGLALVLGSSFLLRLWGIGQGLPYSYNVDEATHFVPRAIAFFSHDLNPHYFLNPPAYSYLVHGVLAIWFGSGDAVMRSFARDPTEVYVVARVVAAVLGTVAVWLTYLAARRLLDRTVALLAAAIFGFSFLPIFYSHLALNDVPTLAPVALSLYGIAGVLRTGRWRDYLLAGASIGLAAATKYTGGITLVCLLAAAAVHGRREALRPAGWRLAGAVGLGLVAFVVANPFSVLDFSSFAYGVSSQAALAAGQDPVKLGTAPGSGIAYYLWTFTWGLGWGPSLAALGGALLLLTRRRLALAAVLLPAPVLFVIFMGSQQRFFGRWLMPLFSIVAILAALGAVELARWLVGTRRLSRFLVGSTVAVLALVPSLVAVVRNDLVLSRPDTRNSVRAWMVGHVPAGAKVVVEPVVPENWTTDIGTSLPWTSTGDRWYGFATWLTDVDEGGRHLPAGQRRYVVVDQYERTLRPELIDEYVSQGFCWLVSGSLQAGRALSQPQAVPLAVAYYARLAKRGRVEYRLSPFAPGARPVPFNFDWSIDYFPRQYRLPGPEMTVLRLHGGRCGRG